LLSDDIDDKLLKNININYVLKNSDNILNSINSEIKNLKEKFQKELDELSKFENIIPNIDYTDFILEKTLFNFELLINNDITLLDIFNSIELSKYIPYVNNGKYYKILKSFIPYKKWTEYGKNENYVYMKVFQKKIFENEKQEEWSDIVIFKKNNKFYVDIYIQNIKLKNYLTKEEIINIFLKSIKSLNPDYNNIKERKVNGYFYIKKQRLDKYVIADIISTDKTINSLFYLDETIKVSKSDNSIYIKSNHPNLKNVAFNLLEKLSIDHKNKDLDYNTFYIRTKISFVNNLEQAKYLQNIISKLFTYYNNIYNSIQTEYKNYITFDLYKWVNFINKNDKASLYFYFNFPHVICDKRGFAYIKLKKELKNYHL
jgi:hypothetical protein